MDVNVYLAAALGVAISVILPLVRAALPAPPGQLDSARGSLWAVAKPYVATAVFSLVVAALIVAYLDDPAAPPEDRLTARGALLAGYAMDSTLQKMSTGNTSAER